ncbi:MAG: hypothetical protein KME23_12925 [Goleter apudmare HA4340-LM2]|jgi:uncharacterized membrane protein|nr:hypothetical protein [Goleter apudmare HA4340-LM2]
MANVAINELEIIGYKLFHDSESFLDELTSQEIASLQGGFGYSGYGGYGSHSGGYGYGSVSGYSGGYGRGFKSKC